MDSFLIVIGVIIATVWVCAKLSPQPKEELVRERVEESPISTEQSQEDGREVDMFKWRR